MVSELLWLMDLFTKSLIPWCKSVCELETMNQHACFLLSPISLLASVSGLWGWLRDTPVADIFAPLVALVTLPLFKP